MSIKVPDVAELKLLDMLRTTLNSSSPKICLFKNNYTPVDSSVLADFTAATFSGYAPVTFTGLGTPATVSGRAVSTNSVAATWTKSGATGNDIYGYYVTDAAGTSLLWAERGGAAPYSMNVNGEGLSITPTLSLATEF